MQLVLSNNRVIAHGENFIAMGGTVINTVTGVKYENATIAECEGCPSDIDSVGYEYHAGQFIPCAPYGKGSGNLAVLCDRDCKAIKDSGVPLKKITQAQLLWENASPTSNFAKQTITLANDDWDILIVETCNNGGSVIVSETSNNTDVHYYYETSTGKYVLRKRNISVTSKTTLSITNTQDVSVDGLYFKAGDNTSYNNILKPYRIYGVKMGVAI